MIQIAASLEEISLAYQCMGKADRMTCELDMDKIITNTLRYLLAITGNYELILFISSVVLLLFYTYYYFIYVYIIDVREVIINGLSLLDHISRDHPMSFVPYLDSVFILLQV